MDRATADLITDVLAVVIVVELLAAIVAAFYVNRVYRSSVRPDPETGLRPLGSVTFKTIARDDIIKVVAGLWIGALAVMRLIPLPDPIALPPWTTPISAGIVIALLWPPIDHAVTIYRLRHAHGDHTPPPFRETD